MIFSSILMNNLYDITCFRIVYSCGLISYLTLILFPSSVALTYIANVMLITSVGGWINIQLLILEMRVPPQNVGSVSALTRTMAGGASVIAPYVASMTAPYPYVFLLSLASFAFLCTFALPPPGMNLP